MVDSMEQIARKDLGIDKHIEDVVAVVVEAVVVVVVDIAVAVAVAVAVVVVAVEMVVEIHKEDILEKEQDMLVAVVGTVECLRREVDLVVVEIGWV